MSRLGGALAATPALLFGSTASSLRELRGADHIIRAPLALSHRIAFVQLSGGTGTSTVAAAVASTLAHRRVGPVLGVNASGGGRTLMWHAGGDDAGPGGAADPRRLRPQSFADASAGLPLSPGGVHLVDVRPGPDAIAATEADWARPIAPITRFFDVVCTDWGIRRPELDLGGVAAGSHAVCVVARADRSGLEDAVAVGRALAQLASQPRVVVAAVDLGGTGRGAAGAVRWEPGTRIVTIPFDAVRSSAAPAAGADLSTASRLATTRLAAALMPEVVR
ncbi:hypothetical protein [Frondihabitans sp. VKM Ac-2883]|uniref:hypothetical protein n=1 Tax=Frondihabitans sp. VKM Ac-2883 TaxID=2783823 RepID=UPI00188BFECD|nr:hypothetical protein [Frondihabitans sp. VKM Ac-2883]MBF4577753.1 hypothetical protein [Frondihabitans sp. VKM Ac-2883]